MSKVPIWLALACALTASISDAARPERRPQNQPTATAAQAYCDLHHAQLSEHVFLKDQATVKNFIISLPKAFHAGTWLQIGANTLDPLAATQHQIEDPLLEYIPFYTAYRKVFVEPIPFIFSALQNNTKNIQNVELVNAAIVPDAKSPSTVTMFCPAEDQFKSWLRGICSLDASVIKRTTPNQPARMVEVNALTVSGLVSTYSIRNIRIAMVDTEGYDVKILQRLFELPDFLPELIVFEHTEITPTERSEGENLLRKHCYILYSGREKTYGLKLVSQTR